jgi:hypothetical protein
MLQDVNMVDFDLNNNADVSLEHMYSSAFLLLSDVLVSPMMMLLLMVVVVVVVVMMMMTVEA